jgi:hypothetical protein
MPTPSAAPPPPADGQPTQQSAHRTMKMSAYSTQPHPYNRASLARLAAHSSKPVGASRMSASMDADAMRNRPDTALSTHDETDPMAALAAGHFAAATQAAAAAGSDRATIEAYRNFQRGGEAMDRGAFASARVAFGRAQHFQPLADMATYWTCESFRLEKRDLRANECFTKAGMTEGQPPR